MKRAPKYKVQATQRIADASVDVEDAIHLLVNRFRRAGGDAGAVLEALTALRRAQKDLRTARYALDPYGKIARGEG